MSLAITLGSLSIRCLCDLRYPSSPTTSYVQDHCQTTRMQFEPGYHMLRKLFMLAFAVAQDSVELVHNDLDNVFVLHAQKDCGLWRMMVFLKLSRTKSMG